MAKARLIFDSSSKNADLYYATGFLVGDPFVYLEASGKKYMVMSDLEIDRAKKESRGCEVLKSSVYFEKAKGRVSSPGIAEMIDALLRSFRIRKLELHPDTSFVLVDALRGFGYSITAGKRPFFQERHIKSLEEKKLIAMSQKMTFRAIEMVRSIIAASKVSAGKLVCGGKVLTSEILRAKVDLFLAERGFIAEDTIIASGVDACDPHCVGHGPIKAGTSIVVDIFPKSRETRYFGDATRTFCKGRAPEALKKLYATVKKGQELALSMVKAGVVGDVIHSAVSDFFTERGYPTREEKGRMVGFFHGTGHAVGLEVHEEPARINKSKYVLAAGNVTSVEPGLYYPSIGGVRIEDLVYVTEEGFDLLGRYPKQLEIL
ncbi:MAG TPA: Xaa-Pro peptidase family protein [bacterium]|nr:MAG: Aminopeptidase [bacterium ADurb.Bin270]HPW45137.1 Xaa-Pro peptidase family protein [bacterium]HQC50317.1 Xaa-Pro peptidase family protein [bacterium]